jgi:hypothetical protein
MSCDVLYIIGKLLERKCLEWARITHLDIWNTSYGQKKGRESNCQFDSQPKKIGNNPIYLAADKVQDTIGKLSTRATTLLRKVMGLQSHRSPDWYDFKTPTRESRERKAIWM